ncbi:hypothetical protein KSC_016340 [Ktedonobacter sp. SOSP1-52]|nr:hypothetical protein KSC_016340 [Ktedonobacter sp. SOSP1-52]
MAFRYTFKEQKNSEAEKGEAKRRRGWREKDIVPLRRTYYYQEVSHLQCVYESMLDLLTAIVQIPEQRECRPA